MDDQISRRAAIDAADKIIERDTSGNNDVVKAMTAWKMYVEALPSAQQYITPDGTLNVSIDADVSSIGRILLSQAGTQYGGLYYKDAQPEIIRCRDCKYGEQDDDGWWYCRDTGYSMGDGEKGDGFCSNAERRTDEC